MMLFYFYNKNKFRKGKETEPRNRKLFRIDYRKMMEDRREEIKKMIEEKEKREAEEAA